MLGTHRLSLIQKMHLLIFFLPVLAQLSLVISFNHLHLATSLIPHRFQFLSIIEHLFASASLCTPHFPCHPFLPSMFLDLPFYLQRRPPYSFLHFHLIFNDPSSINDLPNVPYPFNFIFPSHNLPTFLSPSSVILSCIYSPKSSP